MPGLRTEIFLGSFDANTPVSVFCNQTGLSPVPVHT